MVCVIPPPVAVMVIVRVPVVALDPTLTVIVELPLPGAATELGLKVTVFELPSPDADKVMAALKLPEAVVVIVDVPELPRATVKDVGEAESAKLAGDEEVTISDTVVV